MTVEEWKQENPPIKRKLITNADRIRNMTDEELANWITIVNSSKPQSAPQWLEWLKQEVKRCK